MISLRTGNRCHLRGCESWSIGFTAQPIKCNWLPFSIVLCVFGILGSRAAIAEVKTTTPLTVLLFNRSHASPDTLRRTKKETDTIFSRHGIRLIWTDCPTAPGSAARRLCTDESAPGEIRVRILDRQLKNYLPDATFGFAIPPVWATVYYEPAQRLAQSTTGTESNVPVILGCLIAHEIGHLLLGQNAHAVDGIMRARWEVWQIQEALKGGLGFLPEESKVMLRNAQERTRPFNTSLSEQPASLMVEQRRPD
jgi:hypothetical protein